MPILFFKEILPFKYQRKIFSVHFGYYLNESQFTGAGKKESVAVRLIQPLPQPQKEHIIGHCRQSPFHEPMRSFSNTYLNIYTAVLWNLSYQVASN